MPRTSAREALRTYKATGALSTGPLLTQLLPAFSRHKLQSPDQPHASVRRCSLLKCIHIPDRTIEQYFLSELTQASSCRSHRISNRLKRCYAPKQHHHFHHQAPQTRPLNTSSTGKSQPVKIVTQNRVHDPSVGAVSKSAANITLLQSSDESRSTLQVQDTGTFFKPFYEVIDHKERASPNDESKLGGLKEEQKVQLLAKLSALGEKDHGPDSEDGPAQGDSTADMDGEASPETEEGLGEQIRYLKTVRELEEKLSKARHKLHLSIKKQDKRSKLAYWPEETYSDQEQVEAMDKAGAEMKLPCKDTVKLKKEDVLGLVDLYFYSHRTRFLSESPDLSPTPLQLDDFSFKLSEDFSPPTHPDPNLVRDDEGTPLSPLHYVEAEIKARKNHEIKSLQVFVDLLLDDYSPLKDLFEAYKALPQPGLSYLSSGIIRLFLQRMATPWKRSETAMYRYLSLMDDMQAAGLPVTAWEWESAIYLAGRSFSNVTNSDVAAAFGIWRKMEKEAGVAARHITFNIVFDIAVKGGKYVLAEQILKEMQERGFRLNRLGRVSLIYYYGKKGDGDGVRKAYRDFIEAGEIVDTLVLNCVMASLISAQEPAAAEQTYERMKAMQDRFKRGRNADGEEALLVKYPPPGPDKIGAEMASNSLGRVLLHASRLRATLPEQHSQLQDMMPLTPNVITFRTLISYHARISGNLDRLTVLLDDMTRHFQLPVSSVTFHLLFKGFAMHGGSDRSDAKWTRQRLGIAWAACLVCMKAGKQQTTATRQQANPLGLPSVEDAEAMVKDHEKRGSEQAERWKPRKPTAWSTFIKQFTSTYPNTEPFDMYSNPADGTDTASPQAAEPEEEYHLPKIGLVPADGSDNDMEHMNVIQPSKALALWAIRAFTRCTASRAAVEDVWYHLTRLWRPTNFGEKATAIRELRRALQYCDTHGKK